VEHRDRVVTRTELLDRFWDGKDVYDDALRKTVASIRKALGDNGEHPRFIETHYGEGYRYVGPLELALPPGEPAAQQIETMRAVRIVIEEELHDVSAELGASGASLPIPNRARDGATTLARPRRSVRMAVLVSGLVLIAIAAAAIVYFNRAAA